MLVVLRPRLLLLLWLPLPPAAKVLATSTSFATMLSSSSFARSSSNSRRCWSPFYSSLAPAILSLPS